MPNFITVGDTKRIRATFQTWDGIAADPTDVTVEILDGVTEEVLETHPLSVEANRVQVGTWQYAYCPTAKGKYLLRFKGTLEGAPVAKAVPIEARLVS